MREYDDFARARAKGEPTMAPPVSGVTRVATASSGGESGPQGNPGIDGDDGDDGREVELAANSTHIRWRYTGGSWGNLIGLDSITGPQGTPGSDGSFSAVTLSMPYPARRSQRVNVTDAAVTATSKIIVSVAGVPETAVNTPDFNDLRSVVGIPLSGSIDFLLSFHQPNAGPLAIHYTVSA